jgi:hypothetical protein
LRPTGDALRAAVVVLRGLAVALATIVGRGVVVRLEAARVEVLRDEVLRDLRTATDDLAMISELQLC